MTRLNWVVTSVASVAPPQDAAFFSYSPSDVLQLIGATSITLASQASVFNPRRFVLGATRPPPLPPPPTDTTRLSAGCSRSPLRFPLPSLHFNDVFVWFPRRRAALRHEDPLRQTGQAARLPGAPLQPGEPAASAGGGGSVANSSGVSKFSGEQKPT